MTCLVVSLAIGLVIAACSDAPGPTAPRATTTAASAAAAQGGASIGGGTPDGEPPAVGERCDEFSGRAFGLCKSYCEAMDCDCLDRGDCAPNASEKACERVARQFEAATGGPLACEPADNEPPVVIITSPTDGAVVNSPSVDVGGTVTDAGSGVAEVTVNGAAAAVTGESFLAVDLALVPGSNSIVAVAVDASGNVAADSITVTRQ